MIGKTLSHFRVLEKLGEGGMGVVYKAEDQKLRRPVALKTLRPDRLGDRDSRRRLLREARAAAAVAHPNIAAIYETDEVDRTVFVAMELVEGATLRSRLQEQRPLAVGEVLHLGAQIADALAAAHRVPLVHRDLKPENVAIDASGLVKVLDFGLAKPLSDADDPTADSALSETLTAELTGHGAMLGTVAYMSPEQVRGRPLDGRSDLFALGVLLYEMLTGEPPFKGATVMDTVSAILRQEPPPVAELRPGVPRQLGQILDRLLVKEPADRYPSAGDLAQALRALLQSLTPGVAVQGGVTLAGRQAKLCVCGRSQELPLCDGSHASEDWTCNPSSAVRLAFCAAGRYHNLARKLAAHYRGATCLEGEPCPDAETLITLVDGTDLEFALAVHRDSRAGRRIVVSLGVGSGALAELFPGGELVDLSQVPPLHAFKRISALLDAGELGSPAEAAAAEASPDRPPLRSAFISHAVADEPLILPVKAFLERYYRADVFTCADSIRPGSEWQAEIMQALRQRQRFVFALSEASLASHFCSFEIGVAAALAKPISIVSLDGSRPPVFVQHLQTVDLERIRRTRAWLDRHDVLLDELLKILAD